MPLRSITLASSLPIFGHLRFRPFVPNLREFVPRMPSVTILSALLNVLSCCAFVVPPLANAAPLAIPHIQPAPPLLTPRFDSHSPFQQETKTRCYASPATETITSTLILTLTTGPGAFITISPPTSPAKGSPSWMTTWSLIYVMILAFILAATYLLGCFIVWLTRRVKTRWTFEREYLLDERAGLKVGESAGCSEGGSVERWGSLEYGSGSGYGIGGGGGIRDGRRRKEVWWRSVYRTSVTSLPGRRVWSHTGIGARTDEDTVEKVDSGRGSGRDFGVDFGIARFRNSLRRFSDESVGSESGKRSVRFSDEVGPRGEGYA